MKGKAISNVFYAEDDGDDRQFFVDAFKIVDPGINCIVAGDGQEALEKLPNTSPPPDIIFLDINMPLVDGFECLQEIKKRPEFSAIPVVIISTTEHPNNAIRSNELGADRFVTKPSSFTTYCDLVRQIVGDLSSDPGK